MTISLRLDRGQRRRMTRLLRKTRSRIEALRARVLLLLDEGVIPGVVAEMVGCARATVYRTLYRFEDLRLRSARLDSSGGFESCRRSCVSREELVDVPEQLVRPIEVEGVRGAVE